MTDDRATLKAFFETNDFPTQAQFTSLIDSLLSLVDPDTITGEKTFNSDIITDDDKVIKAKSGGGQFNLRVGTDGTWEITSDNGNFLQSWISGNITSNDMGFGDSSTNNLADIFFTANRIQLATQTIAGVLATRFEILEDKMAFNTKTPIPVPVVTGSRAGNAALASLLTAFDNLGLIIDSTTA